MKELKLKKKEVKQLSDSQMDQIKGGEDTKFPTWVIASTPACVMTSYWFGCDDE